MFAEKIKSALNGHDFSYDLFITINERNGGIEQKFLSFKPDTKFVIVKNIGADVYPFITVLNLIDLDDYDYIIKLHTKRIYDDDRLKQMEDGFYRTRFTCFELKFWNDYLLRFLTFENIKKILICFEKNEKLGMVADYRVIYKENDTKKSGLIYPPGTGKKLVYPAGTMFIARARIFDSVKQLNLDESKFSIYVWKPGIDDKFIYGMERIIGGCAGANGLRLEDVLTPKLQIFVYKIKCFFKYYIKKVNRFFFRIEKGTIKICKISIIKISENKQERREK
jgi:hypothetical protein